MLELLRVPASDALAEQTRHLLEALPDWFGIPEANESYIESATRLAGYVARYGTDTVGVLLVRHHYPETAEIHLIAVAPEHHRQGIGKALLDAAEADLRIEHVRLLQVKTLGPSRPDPGYDKTREFYRSAGFWRLEEMTELWDDDPCLILVKPL